MTSDIEELAQELRQFAKDRDWDKFHLPKNLVMALMVEVGELMEHYQWLDVLEHPSGKEGMIADEMADIFIYLVRMADILDIDLYAAAFAKVAKNAEKYPADLVSGSAKKYNEYDLMP